MESHSSKAIQIIRKKYEESRQHNQNWSQRAFAQKMGVSSGALSEMLSGKRCLSHSVKRKIAVRLALSPIEQLDFFEDDLPNALKPRRLEYIRLSSDQFHLISDWWHYGILNLLKTKGFKPFPEWIARRLDLTPRIVKDALDRLVRLTFIEKDTRNRWIRKHPRLETNDDLLDLSVQRSHLEDLKLMERSLLNVPVNLRDHTSVTFVMNKKDLKKAKEMIRIFQDHFSENIEKDPGDEVYKLTIALYPLSHEVNEK